MNIEWNYGYYQPWSLVFKLSQPEYNIRLLCFIKSRLGVGNRSDNE